MSRLTGRGRRVLTALVILVCVVGAAAAAGRAADRRSKAEAASRTTHASPRPAAGSGGVTLRPGDREHGDRGQTRASRPLNVYAHTTEGLSAVLKDIPERVYVPNNHSNTVSVINPKTYRVIQTFDVGSSPHHVTPSYAMKKLYVNNTSSNTLSVIDSTVGRVEKVRPVIDPYNLYFVPHSGVAVVVAERYQRLDFRHPKTWRLIKSVHIPASGPDHLDFSASGRYLMVSTEFSGWVFRVNTEKMKITGRVRVGGLPVDVKLSPDGKLFYVTNQGLDGVSVIDPKRMKVVKFIPTERGAHGLSISRDTKKLYVSNRLAGSITVISFKTRRKVATWRVGGTPDMLQVSPDGTELWASNRYSNNVSVINTRTGRVTHQIVVGNRPHGLTYFPQPGRYSLGHNGVYR